MHQVRTLESHSCYATAAIIYFNGKIRVVIASIKLKIILGMI